MMLIPLIFHVLFSHLIDEANFVN